MTTNEASQAIDHLVIAGPDLDALLAWWTDRTGTTATAGGPHTGLGTRNALIGIDATTYIELIGPDVEQRDPTHPRPFGIDRLDAPRLVTFAVAVADLAVATAGVRDAGIDPGGVRSMQRLRPDGVQLSWRLATPVDPSLAGIMPFLIEWGDTPHPAASLDPVVDLVALEASHPRPDAIEDAIIAATGAHVLVEPGAPRLAAALQTPNGTVAL